MPKRLVLGLLALLLEEIHRDHGNYYRNTVEQSQVF
jgi:hypothetical protein